jgi:hypothetical protein
MPSSLSSCEDFEVVSYPAYRKPSRVPTKKQDAEILRGFAGSQEPKSTTESQRQRGTFLNEE